MTGERVFAYGAPVIESEAVAGVRSNARAGRTECDLAEFGNPK